MEKHPRYIERSETRKNIEHFLIRQLAKVLWKYSPFSPLHPIEWDEVNLPIQNLPGAFEGFRILQITDIHHGPYTRISDLKKLIEIANSKKPDLFILTGDYVLNSPEYIEESVNSIAQLQAPFGRFAVLGNHDHREGAQKTIDAFEAAGIPMLNNSHVVLEKDQDQLCLGGVDDLEDGEPDAKLAFQNTPEDCPRILLAHNPDTAEFMDGQKVDIMISGHTHGGQCSIPLIGAPFLPNLYKKYRAGMIQGPTCPVYICRGIGATLFPLRIRCKPQVITYTLAQDVK